MLKLVPFAISRWSINIKQGATVRLRPGDYVASVDSESSFALKGRKLMTPIKLHCTNRSHYPERVSALDFKDAATLRLGHSDVVFDLFIETRFLHFINFLLNS